MERHGELHVVAEGDLANLRELQSSLSEAGIGCEIVAPPKEKCSS